MCGLKSFLLSKLCIPSLYLESTQEQFVVIWVAKSFLVDVVGCLKMDGGPEMATGHSRHHLISWIFIYSMPMPHGLCTTYHGVFFSFFKLLVSASPALEPDWWRKGDHIRKCGEDRENTMLIGDRHVVWRRQHDWAAERHWEEIFQQATSEKRRLKKRPANSPNLLHPNCILAGSAWPCYWCWLAKTIGWI